MWWLGHAEHKDDADWLKQCMKIDIEGTKQRKTWRDCVKGKGDRESFCLSHDDVQYRDHWRLKMAIKMACVCL